jgi:hypothetical protein
LFPELELVLKPAVNLEPESKELSQIAFVNLEFVKMQECFVAVVFEPMKEEHQAVNLESAEE